MTVPERPARGKSAATPAACPPAQGGGNADHTPAPKQPNCVAELALAKRLPEPYLREQGLDDIEGGGIAITYYDETGAELYRRSRGEPGKPRFRQPAGVRTQPYALHRLADRGQDTRLFLAEGETDTLTLLYHDLPALGFPGSGCTGSLTIDHLAGVDHIYICPDADQGGETFASGLHQCLKRIGYSGRASVLALPSGIKDINDLHCRHADDPSAFRGALKEMVASATPLMVSTPAAAPPAMGSDGASQPVPLGFVWSPIDSRALVRETERPTWLVKRLLVKDQPCVIGAPQKAGKTSIAIDLAIALATGTPFLGTFEAYRPVRVAMLSGESGRWTILNTAQQVCAARGLDLEQVPVLWQFDLPALANASDLRALADGIRASGTEVVIIDPLYLCLLSGAPELQASNLYQTGPLLLGVARACIDAGATPILLHHAKRPAEASREPLSLGDLAYSGIAEFARQWLLLKRSAPYSAGEPNKLWLAAGGSCGQGGTWALSIDEGVLDDEFLGRRWEVTVETAGNELERRRAGASQCREQTRIEAEAQADTRFLRALDAVDPCGLGATKTAIRDAAKISNTTANDTIRRLSEQGIIEEVSGSTEVGNGASRKVTRVRRIRGDQ